MTKAEQKEAYIRMRAEGQSYSKIAAALHISKSTCSKWEKELEDSIAACKEERLTDLYTQYRIGREAHIEKLGEALSKIDNALAEKDLKEVPADKLLKLKLLYEDKLQSLYIQPTGGQESFTEYNTEEVLKAAAAIYEKLKSGAITVQQGKAELLALAEVNRASIAKDNDWI